MAMLTMRMRTLVTAIAGASLAAAALMQACGGTTTSSGDNTDAGSDGAADAATDVAPRDTGADTGFDAGCDPNHDFTTDIPDAAIPDSSTTTGLCVACVQANCSKEISACAKVCACQNEADKALLCYLKTPGDFLSIGECIGGLPADLTDIENLGACAQGACPDECATANLPDGGDGGT